MGKGGKAAQNKAPAGKKGCKKGDAGAEGKSVPLPYYPLTYPSINPSSFPSPHVLTPLSLVCSIPRGKAQGGQLGQG